MSFLLLPRRPSADETCVRKRLRSRSWVAVLTLCACLAGSRAEGTEFVLSTLTGATLGGVTFRDGDLVLYDDVANTASLVFSEDNFTSDENVDAVHMIANGHILLSTAVGAVLGGLTLRDGDVVEYDPVNDIATVFFNEDLFLSGGNIDAFAILDNGNLVLSTALDDTLAGLLFRDGDLIEYDPVGGTASLFLNEDLFVSDEDIDGVHVLSDGTIILSTQDNASIGGLIFLDGDLVRYDSTSDTATLYFAEATFGTGENVDGVFVPIPEPGTSSLLAPGLLLLARRRR
jgi:hypothetical protein